MDPVKQQSYYKTWLKAMKKFIQIKKLKQITLEQMLLSLKLSQIKLVKIGYYLTKLLRWSMRMEFLT